MVDPKVAEFIKKAQQKGIGLDEIVENLRESGVTDDEIASAYDALSILEKPAKPLVEPKQETPSPLDIPPTKEPEQKKISPILVSASVALLFLAVAGSLYLVVFQSVYHAQANTVEVKTPSSIVQGFERLVPVAEKVSMSKTGQLSISLENTGSQTTVLNLDNVKVRDQLGRPCSKPFTKGVNSTLAPADIAYVRFENCPVDLEYGKFYYDVEIPYLLKKDGVSQTFVEKGTIKGLYS